MSTPVLTNTHHMPATALRKRGVASVALLIGAVIRDGLSGRSSPHQTEDRQVVATRDLTPVEGDAVAGPRPLPVVADDVGEEAHPFVEVDERDHVGAVVLAHRLEGTVVDRDRVDDAVPAALDPAEAKTQ